VHLLCALSAQRPASELAPRSLLALCLWFSILNPNLQTPTPVCLVSLLVQASEVAALVSDVTRTLSIPTPSSVLTLSFPISLQDAQLGPGLPPRDPEEHRAPTCSRGRASGPAHAGARLPEGAERGGATNSARAAAQVHFRRTVCPAVLYCAVFYSQQYHCTLLYCRDALGVLVCLWRVFVPSNERQSPCVSFSNLLISP